MGKIGDLWVRLGLKSDEYKKGMNDAKKETESFSAKLGKMKAGALAVWAAVGTGVTMVAKQFINHSQTMSDKWSVAVNQMKAVWSQFLTSLTSWDWNGFGNRIADAMDMAKRSTAAHDAEFEVSNSLKMRKAAMAEELAQLQLLMRNTQKSYDERAKAAQEYLNKVKPLYDAEIELRKRIYLTDTDEYLKNAGLKATADNRDLLRTFFTDIAPNESLVAILNEYQKKVQGKKRYELSKEDYKVLDDFYDKFGNKSGAALSVLAQYYQSTNDKIATKVVDAITNYDNSIAHFAEETRRIQTLQNSALAQIAGSAGVEAPGAGVAMMPLPFNPTELKSFVDELEPFDLGSIMSEMGIEEGMADVENDMRAFLDSWAQDVQSVAQLNQMLSDSFVSAFGNGMQALTDMMMGIEGADMKSVMAAFIAPFADTMKQMGSMIMSEGIAMVAFKKSFSNPYAAIAAGAALIAVGSAVSSGLQKLTANPTGGSAGSTASGGSYGSSELNKYESTLTVEVTGKISGNDIVLSGKKTNDYNRR